MNHTKSNLKFWDRIAVLYAPFMKKEQRLYEDLRRIFSEYLQKDMKVLELACGSGQLTALLADQVLQWDATDLSPNMIRSARKRISLRNVTFSVQDAAHLPYETSTFDAVLIANALHIIPDPSSVLNEISRILKPDGLLLAHTFVYDRDMPAGRLWFLKRLGFRTFHQWDAGQYAGFLQEHGFEILECPLLRSGSLPECAAVCRPRASETR